MKPHKYAELIKAWADGANIQFLDIHTKEWRDATDNRVWWDEESEYRIKPEPKPDYIHYVRLVKQGINTTNFEIGDANLKLTFYSETGKLKSAEVLK